MTSNFGFAPMQLRLSQNAQIYNYFRDYDPRIARYVESDPIGLKAGANTFVYVRSNSLTRLDRLGLVDSDCGQNEGCCKGVPGGGTEFGGTVMCCGGRKVACTYCNDEKSKGGQLRCGCKMKHELAHMPDVECNNPGNYRAPISSGKYPSTECKAYDVEMNCLVKGLDDCGNDISCQFTLQDRLSVLVVGKGVNHGCR
ncbi:RHS repeat-associated core domain-containing protein [Usitatibacter palustris]